MMEINSLPTTFLMRKPRAWLGRRPGHGLYGRGFTVIELMVTVAILTVLVALAAPSFRPMIEKWRVESFVESMKSSLYFSRSEAIKRGGRVGLQKNANGFENCNSASQAAAWSCGWFVYVDADGNGSWSSGEEILQSTPPSPNITVTHQSGGSNIAVDRYGIVSGLHAKGFLFTPVNAKSSVANRSLCMAPGGRINVIKDGPCPS